MAVEILFGLITTLIVALFVYFMKEQKETHNHVILITHLLFGRIRLNGLQSEPHMPLVLQIDEIKKQIGALSEKISSLEACFCEDFRKSRKTGD